MPRTRDYKLTLDWESNHSGIVTLWDNTGVEKRTATMGLGVISFENIKLNIRKHGKWRIVGGKNLLDLEDIAVGKWIRATEEKGRWYDQSSPTLSFRI